MWTQHPPITELQRIDREMCKIVVDSRQGGKHPLGSTALYHLARQCGGQGLGSVEAEYKAIKIKGALNLFKNKDPAMELMRQFEDRSVKARTLFYCQGGFEVWARTWNKAKFGTNIKQQLKRAQQEKKEDV